MKEVCKNLWYGKYEHLPRVRKTDMFHTTFEQDGRLILYARYAIGKDHISADTLFTALLYPLQRFDVAQSVHWVPSFMVGLPLG